MSRIRTIVPLLRSAVRPARVAPISQLTLSARALSSLPRPRAPQTTSFYPPGLARHASHASDAQPPQAHAGAELRTAIENELEILRKRVAKDDMYLHPLNSDETEFVNMGQVPAPPAGGEVMALLDLAPPGISRDRQKAGPQGKGTHVPLLAHVGQTEPAVPCYPLVELFSDLAPRVLGRVREAVAAQGREVGSASLVAVIVPPSGEKRDLAIPLAIALFRLAMFEGNGHEESAV